MGCDQNKLTKLVFQLHFTNLETLVDVNIMVKKPKYFDATSIHVIIIKNQEYYLKHIFLN